MNNPLSSLRIIEFAGIGPAPFGTMMLADMGADVIRIDRPGGYPAIDPALNFEAMGASGIVNRNRPMVRVNLKSAAGKALVLSLVKSADVLIEGYRPGTMEKLGLGPAECHAVQPRLVFARMTGWGQTGPLAQRAGHDINYIGLNGALSLFGEGDAPPKAIPPLIGDMGGGGMLLALGILAGVLQARQSGQGSVLDAAIIDGSASLYALLMGLNAAGGHSLQAGKNVLDGGRYFYRTYRCSDARYVAVGAIEPTFRAILLDKLGLAHDPLFASGGTDDEQARHERLATIFATKPRDEWAELFVETDACVTPVLTMAEAPRHPHAQARRSFVNHNGVVQAAPSPRFGASAADIHMTADEAAKSQPTTLTRWGIAQETIEKLQNDGILS